MRLRWWRLSDWLERQGSGRTIVDTDRPCSICLQDFGNDSMVVVGPDGPGPAYMVCRGCKALYPDPHAAWHRADTWVSSITAGMGSQAHQRR